MSEKRSFSDFLNGGEGVPHPGISLAEALLKGLREHKENNEPAQVDATTGKKLTFKELLDQSVRAAEGWRLSGIGVGDMIAVVSRNWANLFPAVLGALINCSTLAFVVPASNKDELKHALSLCKPKAILSEASMLKVCMEAEPGALHVSLDDDETGSGVSFKTLLDRGAKASSDSYVPPSIENQNDHVCCILYSSGTTGLPKGVMLTDFGMHITINNMGNWHPFLNERHLVTSQLCWISGILALLSCTVRGATRYFMTASNEVTVLEAIEKWKINRWSGSPALYVAMVSTYKNKKYDLSSMKFGVVAGAPVNATLQKEISQAFGFPIVQCYGTTEVGTLAADWPSEFRDGSVGRVQPWVQFKLLDPDTNEEINSPNKIGVLYAKSVAVMKGYIGNPKATAESFDEQGYYCTGDLVHFDENGFIFFFDRSKEMMKFKNQQIAPAELEALLISHPGVRDVCVLGKADVQYGDLPTAIVVKEPGQPVTAEELEDLVATNLSDYKKLRGGVIFVDSLPKTVSGKTIRRKLREVLRERETFVNIGR